MSNSKVFDKAYLLALEIIKVYKVLVERNEFIISKQLLRCGTSIGANLAEANGAISNADFSAKVSIAYKEGLETKNGLSLLKDSNYMGEHDYKKLHNDTDEISKMLFSILKTTRINKKKT